jgi:hypothetical protein
MYRPIGAIYKGKILPSLIGLSKRIALRRYRAHSISLRVIRKDLVQKQGRLCFITFYLMNKHLQGSAPSAVPYFRMLTDAAKPTGYSLAIFAISGVATR